MRFVVGVAETDGVDGDGLGARSDGVFFEIEDVILVFVLQIVIAESTDEDIVRAVIGAGRDIFPVVAVDAAGIDLDGHGERACRRDRYDLSVVAEVLVAVRPEITRGGAGTGETAGLRHHVFLHRAAFRAGELVVECEFCSVVVDTFCRPCIRCGHQEHYG